MRSIILQKFLAKVTWRKLAYGMLVTLPVIAYVFRFAVLNRHGVFHGEDWDYFAQSYEAARLSILHYHQFPWWNPWVDGGQPLFADPQFGLFSLQMPLVLLFGAVAGLHLSILIYFVLGFWGMYLLFKRIGSTSKLTTTLLSYIFVFSGFNAWHLGGGQYTFTAYLLAPWAFLTVLNIKRRFGWLWFGLVASVMILNAMHYLSFEILLICVLIALIQIVRDLYQKRQHNLKVYWQLLRPYVFALIVIAVLCGVRMLYTFQYIHQFVRLETLDPPESIKLFIASLAFRSPVIPSFLSTMGSTNYGWAEYANYFGFITIGLFSYLFIKRFDKIKSVTLKEWYILALILLAALITLGSFSHLSPFSLLHNLPIFNQMRVPSRFICWVAFGVILFLAKLPNRPIVYILLIISAVDVFAANYSVLNYNEKPYIQIATPARPFEQYQFFETSETLGVAGINSIGDLRLLRATQENYGELYGYEPILNIGEFYYLPRSNRCGINYACEFVMSRNAIVTYWSPSDIKLKRTGPGNIIINMNPGTVWKINGENLPKMNKIIDLKDSFIITNPAPVINIDFYPALL